MNLIKFRPKNETEDLLLSITENSQALTEQSHRQAEETLQFKLAKPRETFSIILSFNLGLVSTWMIGLTSLEVYTSIFNITEENNKFELYADSFDEFSFEEFKDELEEILSISDITSKNLQPEVIGQPIFQAYEKLGSEKSSTQVYILLLKGYCRSPFRDFESFLRNVVGIDEADIQLILKQNNSLFIT